MDHRIPRVGVVICLVLAVGALVTFVYLNNQFQGPNPIGFAQNPFELKVRFKDNKTMPTKQAVLFRGISVGTVTGVTWDKSRRETEIRFTLEDEFRLKRDAAIRIGYRSLLGDPYLAVDSTGSPGQPELKSGEQVTKTETTVDFDEALAFLDEEGRANVKSLIKTVADATAEPGQGERLNGTLGGLSRSVKELHVLTKTLRGQEDQISDLVRTSATVLTTLGSRENQIRTIVSSGRATLNALGSNSRSLEEAVDELPRALASGRESLFRVRPLLAESRPVLRKLRVIAPVVADSLSTTGSTSLNRSLTDLIDIIDRLKPLNKQAQPVLKRLKLLLDQLVPVVKGGAPGARNLVPALAYLTPRAKAIATGYALLGATLSNKDEVSNYGLVGTQLDPSESGDNPPAANCDPATQSTPPNQGYCRNSYPGANDSLNPQPFRGTYPRITPCTVPPRSTPTEPCK